MKLKLILISIMCLLFLFNCNTDFSKPSLVKSGFITINNYEGFDFSHDIIINFKNAGGLTVDEQKKAIDLFFYNNIDTPLIRLMGPPIFVDIEPPNFIISPDSLNPSIKNLDVSDINQVSNISNFDFFPDLLFTNIENILNKPVFAIKTVESHYALIEITDIVYQDIFHFYISFKWKHRPDGGTDFSE